MFFFLIIILKFYSVKFFESLRLCFIIEYLKKNMRERNMEKKYKERKNKEEIIFKVIFVL